MRGFIKFLIFIAGILCSVWFGLKFYFMHVNRISLQVRSDVYTQIQAQHSQFLTYNEIPEMYRNAVIATEDRSFWTNKGIDFKGIGRAIFVDIGKDKPVQGGSTITQQLVHNTILGNIPKSLMWKVRESVYSIGLYDTISKQETFELYANDIYFGQGAYGLYDAAETYFGRAPSELNEGELAMLAGLPNAPSNYNPFYNMTLAKERQRLVVLNMINDGMVTRSQASQILSEPIRLQT